MGGTVADVLKMSTDPVVDMFVWEAAYTKDGLYNPGMWQDPWSGGGIWNAMKDGKVFLAMMHQIDSFFIHGGTHPQMQGYLADPNDMGLAVMPQGLSFELDAAGKPLRTGSRKAGTAGWWWGIPKTAPQPQLSAALAQWITNYENHLAECKVFGMMPIRTDILADVQKVFPKDWMADVFATSIKQLQLNGDTTGPLLREYSDIGKIYLDAWYDIVVGKNYGRGGKIDRGYIRERLKGTYIPQMKEVLGKQYPH
jgi:ABC-type glycerol-3-phosphate transport system substrate-binding protein